MTAFCGFNWIDVADDIGNGDIGGCEFFYKTCVTTDPIERGHLTILRQRLPPISGDRAQWVVVHFGTGDDWYALIEQISQQANDAALCLPAKAKQNDVMPRQNGVNQLRNNGVLVAHDAGKQLLAAAQFSYEIATQLILDREGLIPGRPEFAKGSWIIHIDMGQILT